MNQSLLEILLVFFSTKSSDIRVKGLCDPVFVRGDCVNIDCGNCFLARCYKVNMSIHERLNQIETTLKAITNEPTTDSNNK